MNSYRFLYIIITLFCADFSFAQDTAYIERVTMARIIEKETWSNPASYGRAFRFNHSELSLTADRENANVPFILEKGKGHKSIEAMATSYIRLSKYTTVWGSAAYLTGQTTGIRWNSTTDYDLLAPYLLADTVGGDTERERYQFSGGYTTKVGRWDVGTELQFRAEQEWRRKDPRMKGVVSDLKLKVGATYPVASYRFGVALQGNIYKQSNDVDIYNELGGATEYIFTGLGTYYKRFSGANTDVNYKGKGIATSIFMMPLANYGIFANATFEKQSYERISAEYNSLPLTTLSNNKASISVGYRWQGIQHIFTLLGHYEILSQHGIEHVAGDAVAGVYPVIANLTMYKHYETKTCVEANYISRKKIEWSIGTKVGLISNQSKYIYSYREMNFSHIFGEITMQILQPLSKRWWLDGDFTATYLGRTKANITMPYADMEPYFVQYVNHNFAQQKGSCVEVKAHLRTDYKLSDSRYGVFAELSGGMIANDAHTKRLGVKITLGFVF